MELNYPSSRVWLQDRPISRLEEDLDRSIPFFKSTHLQGRGSKKKANDGAFAGKMRRGCATGRAQGTLGTFSGFPKVLRALMTSGKDAGKTLRKC